MIPKPAPGPVRRFFAVALGVVTLLCTLLWLLTYVFITAQVIAGVYNGPLLGVAVVIFTFPVALICTVVALLLAGPRRCKLAWISLIVYVLPFVVTFAALIGEALWETIKRHL